MRALCFALVFFACSVALAQTQPIARECSRGQLAAAQVTQLGQAINACWAPALSLVEGVKIDRIATGPNAGKVFVTIAGYRVMTDAEVLTEWSARRKVNAGKLTPFRVDDCEITGATRLNNLASVVGAFWSGSNANFRTMSIRRFPTGIEVVKCVGREDVSNAAALAEAANSDIETID